MMKFHFSASCLSNYQNLLLSILFSKMIKILFSVSSDTKLLLLIICSQKKLYATSHCWPHKYLKICITNIPANILTNILTNIPTNIPSNICSQRKLHAASNCRPHPCLSVGHSYHVPSGCFFLIITKMDWSLDGAASIVFSWEPRTAHIQVLSNRFLTQAAAFCVALRQKWPAHTLYAVQLHTVY